MRNIKPIDHLCPRSSIFLKSNASEKLVLVFVLPLRPRITMSNVRAHAHGCVKIEETRTSS